MSHVRFAQPGDIPSLIELGHEMHVNSRYAWMPFDASKLWKTLEVAIQDRGQCVMLASDSAEPGERVFAVLWAKVNSPAFTNELFAEVMHLYASAARRGSPSIMKMLSGARIWANNRKCSFLSLNQSIDSKGSHNRGFAERLGFSAVERRVELLLSR